MKRSLTIGTFDALHLGHQHLLNQMEGEITVVTFANHPSSVLSTSKQTVLTLQHKLHLLKHYNVILLPFTQELSQLSAEAFLSTLPSFTSLHLGYDTRIGYKREGDESLIRHIAAKLGFEAHYHLPLLHEGKPISTSTIRSLIQQGDLDKAATLLGRPYSILGPVIRGSGRGSTLGFRTMNLSTENLCLPPLGVWGVKMHHQGQTYQGVANLGFAPTIRNTCLLEVHIPGFSQEIYDQEIEVIFTHFIRKEKRFLSLEELKQQIRQDLLSLTN